MHRSHPRQTQPPHVVQLKVFWETTKKWAAADLADFRQSVPKIAERLRTEQYWNKHGDIKRNRFTCEDFAIRVLCEYASSKGLPVKLSTDVRTYRNMELYDASQHDRYASNKYGFSEMVMLTFGARDIQSNENTKPVTSANALHPGDILAQAKDRPAQVAHHIQLVYARSNSQIDIYQGNSGAGNWASPFFRLFKHNPANPRDSQYTGQLVEIGKYTRVPPGWTYENMTTGKKYKNKLAEFEFYRWNFEGFNK